MVGPRHSRNDRSQMFKHRELKFNEKNTTDVERIFENPFSFRRTSGDSPCRRGAARGPRPDDLGGGHSALLQSLGQDPHAGTLPAQVPPATPSTVLSAGPA